MDGADGELSVQCWPAVMAPCWPVVWTVVLSRQPAWLRDECFAVGAVGCHETAAV